MKAKHGLEISSDDSWIEDKMTNQYLGSLIAKNLVKARSYDVWKSDAGYPARVKYWAPDNYVKWEPWNQNHVKTTYVQLANGEWRFYSRNVPIDVIESFDKSMVHHCVIVMHEPKLKNYGRAYLAHLMPDVEPTTTKAKERKFIHEGRKRLRKHDSALWRNLKRLPSLPVGCAKLMLHVFVLASVLTATPVRGARWILRRARLPRRKVMCAKITRFVLLVNGPRLWGPRQRTRSA